MLKGGDIIAETAPQRPLTLPERLGTSKPADVVKFTKNLFYGVPGAGKTYLLGTAEDHEDTSPVLVIDIDGGLATIRHRDIEVISIRSMSELKKLYDSLAKEPDYFKTIGIDNLSELQKLDMNAVMIDAKNTAKNPDNVDIYVPSMREWGKSGERMRIIVRSFRDLPAHIIMLAHLGETRDEKTGVTHIHPLLPGKLKNEIAGFFDVVGLLSTYQEAGNPKPKRQIQFANTPRVIAKDRYDVFDDLIKESPTFPQLWELVRDGKVAEPNDAVAALSAGGTVSALQAASSSK